MQSNIDLVRQFSSIYNEILIVSTHVGEIPDDLKKYRCFEIGGGTPRHRFRAVLRLIWLTIVILKSMKDASVYHHMSHRTAVFPGVIFKIFGLRQILWYSHHSVPFTLKYALKIVDLVVTPSRYSFPLNSKKVFSIGQAINIKSIPKSFADERYTNRQDILSVGRVSHAKCLNKFTEILEMNQDKNLKLIVVGEVQNEAYLEELKVAIRSLGGELILRGPVKRREIFGQLTSYCFYFSGTPRGVDRAVIEAAVSGCIVLSDNIGTLELIGLGKYWESKGFETPPPILHQFNHFFSYSPKELKQVARMSSEVASEKNDLESRVVEIKSLFQSSR